MTKFIIAGVKSLLRSPASNCFRAGPKAFLITSCGICSKVAIVTEEDVLDYYSRTKAEVAQQIRSEMALIETGEAPEEDRAQFTVQTIPKCHFISLPAYILF